MMSLFTAATWTAIGAVTAAGAAVYGAAAAGKAQAPNIPPPQAPIAPPQAAKVADANTYIGAQAGTGQAGGAPGVAQTFLTGPGGVDNSSLKLGGTSLLGG